MNQYDLGQSEFDIVINAATTTKLPELNKNIFTPETCCYNLVSSKENQKTDFLIWAPQ